MSTLAHFDSEIISQAVRAQSSRVPTLLPDDPYVVVRQAHLVYTDTESGPVEDLRETEVPRLLLVVPSPVPSLDDIHLIVGHGHTPATVDTESEPEEDPSETEEFEDSESSDTRITSSHSSASSDSTAPLSLDHPFTHTSPTPTPTRVSFHRRTARMARYRSSYETPSPSSSPTLPIRKRYQEDEGHGSEDEGRGSKDEEEAAPAGRQQVVPVKDEVFRSLPEHEGAERVSAFRQPIIVTWVNPEDGIVYINILTYVPPVAPVQTPPSPEWSSGPLPVSPSSPAVPTLVASLVVTLAATITVDKDEFLEERAAVTFSAIWRLILALEAWTGQTDAQRAALWHAIYDTQRENHDLRIQIAEERRERLELTYRVARMERRQESRGE
ncbi:hypothetical protein Tco_0454642 [Tanacetum coccineum]